MQMYCNKVRVAAYVTQETFKSIEKERQKTKETKSGIIARYLDGYFAGGCNVKV